jgi:hypothetical protein
LQPASLNGYGASLSGPLLPYKTFSFAAFEKVAVNDTAMQLMPVPSPAARAGTQGPYGILLNAFPLPVAPSVNPGESLATVALKKQASVENYSARIDQMLGDKWRIFARLNAGFRWITATVGSTLVWKDTIQDFRFNFSRVAATSSWAAGSDRERAAINFVPQASYQQIAALPGQGLLEFFGQNLSIDDFVGVNALAALSIAGVGQLVSGTAERTYQNQWEGGYTFSYQRGSHDFRVGVD